MKRFIDLDETMKNLAKANMSRTGNEFERFLLSQSTVEAIPKAEVKKFLEEGTKNVSNNVLAIVREDYIHKADYENRIKADMATIKQLSNSIKALQKANSEITRAYDKLKKKIDSLEGNK